LRIAIIVTDLTPPRIGGISKVATELAHNLCLQGHDVEVFCLSRSESDHLEAPFKIIPVKPKWMLYKEYPVMSFSLAAFRALLKRHAEKPFDVSHAMNFNNYGLTFWRKKMTQAGLAHVSTGFETTQMEIAAKWKEFKSRPTLHNLAQILMEVYLAPWQRSYLGWADVVTTEDIETKEGLMKMGIPAQKIECIPSGIDLGAIEKNKQNGSLPSPWLKAKRILLCPGRVDPRKGSQYLLRAFARLHKQEDLGLIFAGGGRGDYIKSMRRMISELNLDSRVLLTGRVENLYPYYQNCDLVVIPSLSEGIPITLQEALAFEKPILCSRLKGTYHYAKSLPSIRWSEPADVDSLEIELRNFLERPVKQESIEKGFEFIAKADWAKVAEVYAKAYARAIQLKNEH
jgi:glycosyltransferase involved in cell wall biosynthesis